MSNLELVSFESLDKLKLPGLLYRPGARTKKVAIWLHGMGDTGIFYSPERINTLGNALTANNIALLAFNNRGAHDNKKLRIVDEALPEEDRSYQGGTYFEKIADCINDIDGSLIFLKSLGFSEFYLLGHSTGANKICAYHVGTKNNPFSKYVLAGPGDDSGIFFKELGEKRFWRAIAYATKIIKSGKPLQIMPRYTGMYPFSAQSALDIMDPNGAYNTFPYYEFTTKRLGKKPLFYEYKQLDRPTLIIFGENDEYAFTAGDAANALEIFRKVTNKMILKESDFRLIPDADHSFHEREALFAQTVSDWLAK